jgi:hypothetical protein
LFRSGWRGLQPRVEKNYREYDKEHASTKVRGVRRWSAAVSPAKKRERGSYQGDTKIGSLLAACYAA